MYVQELTVVNLLIPNTMNDDFAMRRDFNCTWFLMPESALSCHGFFGIKQTSYYTAVVPHCEVLEILNM